MATLSENQISRVQASWQKVAPHVEQAAELFYGKLFELDPALRPLFSADMTEQKKKLMKTIGFAVHSLKSLETIVPTVQDLGRRHVNYGVKDAHYATVGEALIWTLSQALGDEFDEELREAWVTVYTLLANTMKEAAAGAA
ncbi:MAG: globin family protein [bacterium]|jgi:hemoglobin-like flavoprotein|nr:globin family protein [bacterium]